jgi:hypothetical protein
VDIGTDSDGRSITYDSDSQTFSIGGMPTAVGNLVVYDRSGQVRWASDEIRAWALDFDQACRDHAQETQASSDQAAAATALRRAAADDQTTRVTGVAVVESAQSCGTCRYFVSLSSDAGALQCHRYPGLTLSAPSLGGVLGSVYRGQLHAPSDPGSWCGEWSTRQSESGQPGPQSS